MITAIHINSTAPFAMNNPGVTYRIQDFDLLTTVLSVVMWRELNGPVKLYTDTTGRDYYDSLGLLGLWDEVNTAVVENIPDTVNQQIFWAASKIFALRNEPAPVAMIDTDLIVWKNIAGELAGKRFAVLHREELYESCYLPGFYLKKRDGYRFDPAWDWTVMPCNMALAYFADAAFKRYYTDCSIDFMTGNNEYPEEMISQMVFAEQRIVSMCATKMDVPIHHFLDDPFQPDNDCFSHIWGAKEIARSDPGACRELCEALLRKIKRHSPQYHDKLSRIDQLKPLFRPGKRPRAAQKRL